MSACCAEFTDFGVCSGHRAMPSTTFHTACEVLPQNNGKTGVCIEHGVLVYRDGEDWPQVPLLARVTYRGRTYKEVRLTTETWTTDQEVIDAAMLAAGETRETLFGWTFKRFRGMQASVMLHTS